MTLAIWPGSLPQFAERRGYGIEADDKINSFEPEKGKPIERAETTVAISEMSLSFIMTLGQLQTFKHFVRSLLKHGTEPFMIPHPDTRNQVEVSLSGQKKFRESYYSPLERRVAIKLLITGEDA